jgi:hypothetical protein
VLPDPHTSVARLSGITGARARADAVAAGAAFLLVLFGGWVWQRAASPPVRVAFIHYAVATVREPTTLRASPIGGAAVADIRPGDRFSVGGRLPLHAGLARADAFWVALTTADGVVHGYLPEASVVLIAGDPPVLAATGIPAAETSTVSSAQVESPREVDIPWLPDKMRPLEPFFAAAGAAYGVDPDLLAIVTLVESGGNPKAVSGAGATGLMQLMPATAQDIATQRGIPDFASARLAEPGLNIDFGAYYLSRMLSRFGEVEDPDWRASVDRAAAAYNGGPGSVDAWLAGGELPAETERYRTYVSGMWAERRSPASPTYEAWLQAGGWRLVMPEVGPPGDGPSEAALPEAGSPEAAAARGTSAAP